MRVPSRAEQVMTRTSRIGVALAAAFTSVVAAARAPITTSPQVAPAAPGFAPWYQSVHDWTKAADQAREFEALFGKISTRLGPTNPRWSTISGDLKPEEIARAMDRANAGYPFELCDMFRRAVENDAHLAGTINATFSPIVAKADNITPPPSLARDACAVSVANFLRAVREQIEGLDAARYALLWAEGQGYAAAEIIYGMRRIIWYTADGRRISDVYCVPVKLEVVEGRAFQFDVETDEPRLWLQGDYLTLPPGKFIFHVSHGVTQTRERHGFMRSVLPLSAIKNWCIRDLAIYLHLYGIPQVIMQYDQKHFQYEQAKDVARKLAEQLGQGGIGTVPTTHVNFNADLPLPNGALVHTDAASWLNTEITKAVTGGGPLTMESTGGGYNLGITHAAGAFNTAILRAANLCDSQRRDMYTPTLQLNQYRLAQALGYSPDDVCQSLSDITPNVEREIDQEKRQRVFSNAMTDGCPVSLKQYRAENQLDEPQDDGDKLLGKGVPVPSSGGVVSAVNASEGVILPQPNAPGTQPSTGPDGQAPTSDTQTASARLDLTATAQAAVVKVNEARAQMGLPPFPDDVGNMSIAEYMAKQQASTHPNQPTSQPTEGV